MTTAVRAIVWRKSPFFVPNGEVFLPLYLVQPSEWNDEAERILQFMAQTWLNGEKWITDT